MFVPASLVDADEKDAFATTARLVCIANAATVSVMALEAWMKSATSGEKMDMTEPPSEAFDRQEVIVLMGGVAQRPKTKIPPHHPQWQREILWSWRNHCSRHGQNGRPLRTNSPDENPGQRNALPRPSHVTGQRRQSIQARRNRPASAPPPLIFARTILKSH